MSRYAFEVLALGLRLPEGAGLERKAVTTDLPDREAARDFAIELAESLLREQDGLDGVASSLIAIRDEAGDTLDVVRSETF